MVVLNKEPLTIRHERRAHTVWIVGDTDIFLPDHFAGKIQGHEIATGKDCKNQRPVRRHRRSRIAGIFGYFRKINSRFNCRRPKFCSAKSIVAEHLLPLLVGTRDKNPIIPDDGRIKAMHKNVFLPQHPFARVNIPLSGYVR